MAEASSVGSRFRGGVYFLSPWKIWRKIPIPLVETVHGTSPNTNIYFDYLFLGGIDDGKKYILALEDDFSRFCWLEPIIDATAEHAAMTLARWNRTF